ncbi:hypothetical protein [Nocardia nepalensis]|uniref:hypothetical protein n=1 Tax=Nocardia nepalensis TaxID=3375448 RepID=UPI003B678498
MSDNTFHENPETPTTTGSPPNAGEAATVGESASNLSTHPELDTSPTQVENLALRLFYAPERIGQIRAAGVGSSVADDEADAQYTRRLREVQNLAAATTLVADAAARQHGHDGSEPELQALTEALGQARRDALRDGVAEDDVMAAELAGTEGVPWAVQPSHRWLGRIEQLSANAQFFSQRALENGQLVMQQRMQAIDQNTKILGLEYQLKTIQAKLRDPLGDNAVSNTDSGPDMDIPTGAESVQHPPAETGSDIGEAIDATLRDLDSGQWATEAARPPEHPSATAGREPEL